MKAVLACTEARRAPETRCRNGLHVLDPNDPWKRPNGARCWRCHYRTQSRYEQTAKALRRKIDYDLLRGRKPEIQIAALAEREAYEASGSSLSFIDWLNEVDPLPKLPGLGEIPWALENLRLTGD